MTDRPFHVHRSDAARDHHPHAPSGGNRTRHAPDRCNARQDGTWAIPVALLLAALGAVTAPASASAEVRILSPSLGRPVFVPPGGNFPVVVDSGESPTALTGTRAHLVGHGGRRITLETPGQPPAAPPGVLTLRVPEATPECTYDLELSLGGGTVRAPHAVAVMRPAARLRVVHLGNFNIGDPTAPRPDRRLVSEINLVAPHVILTAGDLVDAAHPDPAAGWRAVVEFLTAFDAPVIAARGDHDDGDAYQQHIASSAVGEVAIGAHRVLVLLDHPLTPISADPQQVAWVAETLAQPLPGGIRMLLSHDDSPGLLQLWQQQGHIDRLRQGRVALWLVGGHRDWRGREHAALLRGVAPTRYVRTAQSSPATRDTADGVSRFRVIDLESGRISEPTASAGDPPPSIAVGRLSCSVESGPGGAVTVEAVNRHPFRLDHLATWVDLPKSGGEGPWVLGGRLEQAIEGRGTWRCRVGFDLPEKSRTRLLVGTGPKPQVPDVDVQFRVPRGIRFEQRSTADGVSYLSAASAEAWVAVRNRGTAPVQVTPLVRLDGDPVPYRQDGSAPFATAYRLRLAPGEAQPLQLDLSVARVKPGLRELQVSFPGASVDVPACRLLHVQVVE